MLRQLKPLGFDAMTGDEPYNPNDCSCKITHYVNNNIEIRGDYITARDAAGEHVQTSKMQLNSNFLNQFLRDYLIQ